ncbi:hypothetical protein L0337_18135 [candidate division KSB1 bacterium]|nr:hypothetical protein [candidate division KSB1 bacterium]
MNANYTTPVYYNVNDRTQTTYQTGGELLLALIRTLGAEVAKNFYAH